MFSARPEGWLSADALKVKHRPYTCMSTPRGLFQWKLLVMDWKMGMQCTSAWYIVFSGIRSTPIHMWMISLWLNRGKYRGDNCKPRKRCTGSVDAGGKSNRQRIKKGQCVYGEVEFYGHNLKEGRRSPAPGKLLSIQKWELPGTVTAFRGFWV